jgi:hypothetical protein
MKTTVRSYGVAGRLFVIGLLCALSAAAMADDKPMNLRKSAEAIRQGKVNVGKDYSLGEEGRFHQVHEKVLGIKCGGCHSDEVYPEGFLYLRKGEFPKKVAGEKVKTVSRAVCIGCHTEGSVGTAFYNVKH